MGVEVGAASIANVFQALDKEEGRFQAAGTEPQTPAMAPRMLEAQVNLEGLSGLPGLGHPVHEVDPGHVLVGHFWVDAIGTDLRRHKDQLDGQFRLPRRTSESDTTGMPHCPRAEGGFSVGSWHVLFHATAPLDKIDRLTGIS
jgi:hypothetical protein